MANSDLDKFYKALDRYHMYTKYSRAIVHIYRAITQYHKAKMQEVNKIIQELWIKIYKGGGRKRQLVVHYTVYCSNSADIDNIEIVSDDEIEGSSLATRRRVYNHS